MCARVTVELLTRCDHVLAQWMVETASLSHSVFLLTTKCFHLEKEIHNDLVDEVDLVILRREGYSWPD